MCWENTSSDIWKRERRISAKTRNPKCEVWSDKGDSQLRNRLSVIGSCKRCASYLARQVGNRHRGKVFQQNYSCAFDAWQFFEFHEERKQADGAVGHRMANFAKRYESRQQRFCPYDIF